MKNGKRLFSWVLVVCMLMSLSTAVLAAEDSTVPVNVSGGESVTVGNVTVTDGSDAASAEAGAGESTTLTVEGDVKQTTSDISYPVDAYASGEGASAAVNISGSVEGQGIGGGGVYVSVDGGDAKVDVGGDTTFTSTGEHAWVFGVYSYVKSDSGSADVSIGGDLAVSGNSAAGVVVGNADGHSEWDPATETDLEWVPYDSSSAESTVTVGGDVTVSTKEDASGVNASANVGGTTTVEVGGDVTVSGEPATGVNASATQGSATTVTVGGDVTAESDSTATGLSLYAGEEGKTSVTVGGDVSAEGADATGVEVYASEKGAVSVTVEGSVSAEGEDYGTGIWAVAFDGGSVDVHVVGDVDGGIEMAAGNGEPSAIKITVEGTVSDEDTAVTIVPSSITADEVTLILWKAELNENGNVVEGYQTDLETVPEEYKEEVKAANEEVAATAAEIEDKILYIIKYEQLSEGGKLSVSGTTQVDGFDVAKEGDNVVLKIAVADGYQLNGAFNGLGEKVPLLKDSNGEYYVIVPKGGGVYLSASVSKIETQSYYAYKPARKLIAKTVADIEGSEKEAKLEVRFYDDYTFEIRIDGQTRIKGDYKFVGDDLVFVLKDRTQIKANDDGLFVFKLDGGTIAFSLSDAFLKDLKSKL